MEYGAAIECSSFPACGLAILNAFIFLVRGLLSCWVIEVKSQQNVDISSHHISVITLTILNILLLTKPNMLPMSKDKGVIHVFLAFVALKRASLTLLCWHSSLVMVIYLTMREQWGGLNYIRVTMYRWDKWRWYWMLWHQLDMNGH